MKNLNKIAIIVSVVALVVAAGVYFQSPQPVKPFGATPGTTISGSSLSVGGVETFYGSVGINSASTTICSLKSPSATSTLRFASVAITTATGTAIVIDMAKDVTFNSTTTKLALMYSAAASERLTNYASTTSSTLGFTNFIFGPNYYFNVKYGSSNGETVVANNGLAGTCKAEWTVN